MPVASFTPPPKILVEVLGAVGACKGVEERVLCAELERPDLRTTVPRSHALDFDIE